MAAGNGSIATRIALPDIAALLVGQAETACAGASLGRLPYLPYCPTYGANSLQVYALSTYLSISIYIGRVGRTGKPTACRAASLSLPYLPYLLYRWGKPPKQCLKRSKFESKKLT